MLEGKDCLYLIAIGALLYSSISQTCHYMEIKESIEEKIPIVLQIPKTRPVTALYYKSKYEEEEKIKKRGMSPSISLGHEGVQKTVREVKASDLIGNDRAAFYLAMNFTLGHEGGYTNNRSDPGGETKFGICKRQYPTVEIKNLTIEDAEKIYKRDYWDKIKLDDFDDDELRIKIFDVAVNCGTGRAIILLKRAYEKYIGKDKYPDNGTVEPELIKDINETAHGVLLKEFIEILENYYKGLVDNNPKLSVFLKGWDRRAESDPDDFKEAPNSVIQKIIERLKRDESDI